MDYSVPDVGDEAPVFDLEGSSGESESLGALKGANRAVLFFYPRDFTSGCQNQLLAAGKAVERFRDVDAQLFGINFADADSHLRFRTSMHLPFDLLVDEGLDVARAYGVLNPDPDNPGQFLDSVNRTVIVVGKDGRIIYRRAGAPPVDEILAAIESAED